jgi:hypothetical protein
MRIWFPTAEEAAERFPADVFDKAYSVLEDAAFLDLPRGEREDSYLHRQGRAEQLFEQLMLIWGRLRDDRLRQVDWHRRQEELLARRRDEDVHSFSTTDDPEYAALAHEGFEIETAVWVDYKSFFLFGELLLGEYASFSEHAWDAPLSVVHTDGITKFWRSVDQATYEPILGRRRFDRRALDVAVDHSSEVVGPLEVDVQVAREGQQLVVCANEATGERRSVGCVPAEIGVVAAVSAGECRHGVEPPARVGKLAGCRQSHADRGAAADDVGEPAEDVAAAVATRNATC